MKSSECGAADHQQPHQFVVRIGAVVPIEAPIAFLWRTGHQTESCLSRDLDFQTDWEQLATRQR